MYISLIESIRSSLTHLHGFQQAAAIVHRNHFLHLRQKVNSFESMEKFRQASNCCKRVLEAGKLAYANKTRVHHFPETWLFRLVVNCQ